MAVQEIFSLLRLLAFLLKLKAVMQPDPNSLPNLVKMKMPFGKYENVLICDLPVSYLEWFKRKGFPKGKLGMLMETMYEIKLNGLESLLKPLRQKKHIAT